MIETVPEEIFYADPAKHAFVTWAIIGDKYVSGALVLGKSIRQQGSKASLVVMISSDVSAKARELLKQVFDEVVEVDVIDVKVPQKRRDNKHYNEKMPFFPKAFTKLHALKLTKFEKIALLDADQLCAAHPDAIFQVDGPAGICTSLLRPVDGAHHGLPLTHKQIDSCYKESGIRGCTYVLKPSQAEFDRAIKTLTVRPKITELKVAKEDTMSLFSGTKSAFAALDSDDDDDDVVETKSNQRTTKVVRDMTPAEIADAKAQQGPKPDYPYKTYEIEAAPMGFAYGENKKSLMSYDEILFTDMYRNQWKHLHNKFGHTSWKKNETAPVFLHFIGAYPGSRTDDWPDYEAWDAVALEIMDSSKDAKDFFIAAVPILEQKAAAGSAAPINPPVVAPKKNAKKAAKKEEAAPAATVPTVAGADATVKPLEEGEEAKPVHVPAAVPVKSAWGAPKASASAATFPK